MPPSAARRASLAAVRHRAAAVRSPSAATVDLEVYAAASLKQAMAAGRRRRTRPRTRHDAHRVDRLVRRARDEDRAGRAGRRVPVGGHDQPAEARRWRVRIGRRHAVRRQRPHDHRASRQPGRDPDACRPREVRASRSSRPGDAVPITTYATQLVDNLARESGYPADFAAAYAANVVSQEDNVAGHRHEGRARRGRRRDRVRHRREGLRHGRDGSRSRTTRTCRRRTAASSSKASPDQEAAAAFLTWLAGSDGQAVLAELGFLPPGP